MSKLPYLAAGTTEEREQRPPKNGSIDTLRARPQRPWGVVEGQRAPLPGTDAARGEADRVPQEPEQHVPGDLVGAGA